MLGIKAGGDAHIVDAEAGGEGVDGFILAAAVPVIAKAGDHIHAKIPLLLFGEGRCRKLSSTCGLVGDGLDQLHLLRAQGIEDGFDIGGLHAGFKIIQQRIVDMVVRGKEGGVFAAQFNNFFQVRLEGWRNYLVARACAQASCARVVTWANSATFSVGIARVFRIFARA